MTTYRERRLRRAEKLDEWAEKREAKATAAHQASRDATAGIPFGQPIIVGHYSERRHRAAIERGRNAADAALEHGRKASNMASRAESIRAQADHAIYSDDHDAADRLRERIEALEAERGRIKAYNASCRKAAKTGEATGDLSLLNAAEKEDLLTSIRVGFAGPQGQFPAYKLQNLGGNIKRNRDRLVRIEREAEHGPRDRIIVSKYGGACEDCGAELVKGQTIRYNRQQGARCVACGQEG